MRRLACGATVPMRKQNPWDEQDRHTEWKNRRTEFYMEAILNDNTL